MVIQTNRQVFLVSKIHTLVAGYVVKCCTGIVYTNYALGYKE